MKTPREVAHEILYAYCRLARGCDFGTSGKHSLACDQVTATIEERDRDSRPGVGEATADLLDVIVRLRQMPVAVPRADVDVVLNALDVRSAEVERLRGELEARTRYDSLYRCTWPCEVEGRGAGACAEQCASLPHEEGPHSCRRCTGIALSRLRTLLEEGAGLLDESPDLGSLALGHMERLRAWARKARKVL